MSSKELCRKLRKNLTPAEKVFWQVVRNRKVSGKRFLRQYPIDFEMGFQKRFFIADFYCHEAKLVVELDGKIHELQKEFDDFRSSIIETLGITVIRFRNEEVLENIEEVIKKVKELL